MNIFYLDSDPNIAAQMMCDKHVGRGKSKDHGGEAGKMIVEASQLLANCYTKLELQKNNCPKTQTGYYRTHSHYNHPCSKWARYSIENFNWLLKHALAMVDEKIYRGGKEHFCKQFLLWCQLNPPNLMNNGFIQPPQCMPEQYHDIDSIRAYRDYYWYVKRFSIKTEWLVRPSPAWWTTKEDQLIDSQSNKLGMKIHI